MQERSELRQKYLDMFFFLPVFVLTAIRTTTTATYGTFSMRGSVCRRNGLRQPEEGRLAARNYLSPNTKANTDFLANKVQYHHLSRPLFFRLIDGVRRPSSLLATFRYLLSVRVTQLNYRGIPPVCSLDRGTRDTRSSARHFDTFCQWRTKNPQCEVLH